MTTEGVSQSTGIERRVEVEAEGAALRLTVRDRRLGIVLGRAVVPGDALAAVLAVPPAGPQAIPSRAGSALRVEVRRNEVLLGVGPADAAVGLDDLLDAVADVLPQGADA